VTGRAPRHAARARFSGPRYQRRDLGRDHQRDACSAVPEGTKIVILAVNGYNDARKLPECSANSAANIAAIKSQLKARGIKVIDAMGIYSSVIKQPGMAVTDRIHLSVEGNGKVATILAGMLK
jgi:acyl-CoA thioesterase I